MLDFIYILYRGWQRFYMWCIIKAKINTQGVNFTKRWEWFSNLLTSMRHDLPPQIYMNHEFFSFNFTKTSRFSWNLVNKIYDLNFSPSYMWWVNFLYLYVNHNLRSSWLFLGSKSVTLAFLGRFLIYLLQHVNIFIIYSYLLVHQQVIIWLVWRQLIVLL